MCSVSADSRLVMVIIFTLIAKVLSLFKDSSQACNLDARNTKLWKFFHEMCVGVKNKLLSHIFI